MADPSSDDKSGNDILPSRWLRRVKKRPKNPDKVIQAKSNSPKEPTDNNIIGNITKLLPTNTFLMFQTLAPLATNDGHCGKTEIIVTSVMLAILASTCLIASFTDTVRINNNVYHGLVTRRGLWNPSFNHDPSFNDLRDYDLQKFEYKTRMDVYRCDKKAYDKAKMENMPLPDMPEEPKKPKLPTVPYVKHSTYYSKNSQYNVHCTDVLHAVLSVMAFATLTMFTSPVSTCFYPNLPSTVVKTVPLLVAFLVTAIFAFTPPARNGIGYSLPPTSKETSSTDNSKPADSNQPRGGKGDHGQAARAIPMALALYEVAKSVSHEGLEDRLVNFGAHPDLAKKVAQAAKDAVVTKMDQEQNETLSQVHASSTPATRSTTQLNIKSLGTPQGGSQFMESHVVDVC